MNRDLRTRVYAIAKKVRSWTQQKADRANYNAHNLCGWCAISSAELHTQLSQENINSELHYVGGHCFVVVDDYIVDVTATQFANFEDKEINIIHLKEADEFWYYQTSSVFSDAKALQRHQIKQKWPKRQLCYIGE
jgi:hypothetical protein